MTKLFNVLTIILMLLIMSYYNQPAFAQKSSGNNFILPKTFKINDELLPPLDLKTPPAKTVPTSQSPTKQVPQTAKTYEQKPTPQKINTDSAVYKKPIQNVNTIQADKNLNKPANSVSLSNLIKKYDSSYENTLKSTIIALSSMEITTDSYNTDKGQIIAKLNSGREILILLTPYNDDSTYVRITPADGNYNISTAAINGIFVNIQENLK